MEEVINKPEEQFQDVLEDLIDFDKNSERKSALIEEVCRNASKQHAKPAASLNSSIYSSAASSSSSTSSASESSTNSASSSSTSSTLSSPSQSNQSNGDTKESRIAEVIEDYDNLEMPKMEELGKTARILEHISCEQNTAANDISIYTATSHSDRRSTNLYNQTQRLSSQASQTTAHKLTQLNQQANLIQHNIDNANNIVTISTDSSADNTSLANSWKTMIGKRDKRKRKPTEQPVLSQNIPGHRGEQEVESLVKYIESGPGAGNISSSSTKKGTNNKGGKSQPKRQAAQSNDLDRENQQRKPNNIGGNNKSASNQSRSLVPQNKLAPSSHQIASMHHSDQRKEQPSPNNNQSQSAKQQSSSQERAHRVSERKEPSNKPLPARPKLSLERKQDKSKQDNTAVTFADHIRVNDDDGQRYTFGFFEEQRQQTNQVKPNKLSPKHNEKSNSKTSQVGQKHKIKHPKASLHSEQERYKCTDNIDANSFNYYQILEFISNSWESTAKSHRFGGSMRSVQ